MGTLLEQNLNEVTNKLKQFLQATFQIKVNRNQCEYDGSWRICGQASRDGILDVCSDHIDKLFHEKKEGQITPVEYLKWYTKHKPDEVLSITKYKRKYSLAY